MRQFMRPMGGTTNASLWLTAGALLAQMFSAIAQPGVVDPTFVPPSVGSVYGFVPQPGGRVVARVLASGSYKVVRFETNGALDAVFNVNTGSGNDVLRVIPQLDGKLIVSGNFVAVNGAAVPCITRLNVDGEIDPSFQPALRAEPPSPPPPPPAPPTPGGALRAAIGLVGLQPDQKIVLSGFKMTATNGAALDSVIRLNTDGSLDDSFSITVTSKLDRLFIQPDGKILLADTLWQLRRFNADGSADASFATIRCDSQITSAAFQDGRILLGGAFTAVNGVRAQNLARLNDNGTVDPTFVCPISRDLYGAVQAIVVQPDNRIVIGGNFFIDDALVRTNLARLEPDGSLERGFASPGADRFVNAVTIDAEGRFLVGGDFHHINGASRNSCGRLLGDFVSHPGRFAFRRAAYDCSEATNEVRLQIERLWGSAGVASVHWTTLGGSAEADSDFVPTSGVATFAAGETLKSISVALVNDSAIEDGETFSVAITDVAGGGSIGFPDSVRVNVFDDDGPSSIDPFFHAPDFDLAVHAIGVLSNGELVVGGGFTYAGDLRRTALARLNSDGSLNADFHPEVAPKYATVSRISVRNGMDFFLAGFVEAVDGHPSSIVLITNGTVDRTFSASAGYSISQLQAMPDGSVFADGFQYDSHGFATQFGETDPVLRFGIGAFDFAGGKILALPPFGRDVIRLNNDDTRDTNFHATTTGFGLTQVKALAADKVLVAGWFSSFNGVDAESVVRLLEDGQVDEAFASGMGLFHVGQNPPYVNLVRVQPDGKIICALQMFTNPRKNLVVRLNEDGSLDTAFEPVEFSLYADDRYGDIGNVILWDIALQEDGKILVAGDFQFVNGWPRKHLVRLKGGGESGSRALRLKSLSRESGGVQVELTVPAGRRFVIESSADLRIWLPLSTNISAGPTFRITDAAATGAPQRFYRAVQR